MTEIQLQAKCYQDFWNKYPQYRRLLFSVPNGGKRTKVEAMQLQASGLVAGIPDMLFIYNFTVYPLEFKTPTGVLSPEQKTVHKAFQSQGINTFIIRTEAQFWGVMGEILNGK